MDSRDQRLKASRANPTFELSKAGTPCHAPLSNFIYAHLKPQEGDPSKPGFSATMHANYVELNGPAVNADVEKVVWKTIDEAREGKRDITGVVFWGQGKGTQITFSPLKSEPKAE